MMRLAAIGFLLVGCTSLLRAQDAQEQPVADNDTSPYHLGLVAYKAGKFQEAYDVMSKAPAGAADVVQFDVLESKVLTELKRYDEGEKLLRGILTPTGPVEVHVALGDLLLRKHSFDRAAKYYTAALQAKPNDPDITLKLIYAKIGSSDLIGASQYASQLKPLDPKNPYDSHASYYFAKAALAQATQKTSDAEEDIENARTIYGNTITDRYLKLYLEVFASSENGAHPDLVPAPLVKPATK